MPAFRPAAVCAVLLAVGGALSGPAAAAAEAPPLVLTLNKAQLLRLAKPAHQVILGNPTVAEVTVDGPTRLTLFGRVAGETSLTVLGEGDRVLLSRPLVVTAEPSRHLTVHVPAGDGNGRRDYSCLPDRCLKDEAIPAAVPVAAGSVSPAEAASPVGKE